MTPFSRNIEDYPDGIILPVDKPYRWTSADVIRKIKWLACRHFGKKNLKVGHAGTLDPLATGILLVCIGPATRKAEQLQASAKEYIAGISFGATTPSFDLEKDIDRVFLTDGVTREALESCLASFTGEQDQAAPLFSAKSVDGVRAYETARKLFRQGLPVGDTDILRTNRINIYELELLDFGRFEFKRPTVPDSAKSCRINVADISGRDLITASVRVSCSKGTYIRSLARDIGEALGSGAFLSSLRRTKNGGFDITEAVTIEEAISLFPAA